jgi:hypothetical protein
MGGEENGEGRMIGDGGYISCSHWGLIRGSRLLATYHHVPVFESDYLDDLDTVHAGYFNDLPWATDGVLQVRTKLPDAFWRQLDA